MSNQITNTSKIKEMLETKECHAAFEKILGSRAQQFVTSVLSVVNENKLLQKADWVSLYGAAMTAATLDLPINKSLGLAYIVPYKGNAQFQMGYRGYIQLAQRTGDYDTINVTEVREGEIKSNNRLTGKLEFDWIEEGRESKPVVGYVAYISLLNGFTKSLYMTKEQLEAHGRAYSASYNAKSKFDNSPTGLWKTNFDAMAKKTVIKLLISKYGPLSTEMQTAITHDQGVIGKDNKPKYIDNVNTVDAVDTKSNLQLYIEDTATSTEMLDKIKDKIQSPEEQTAFDIKYKKLLSK